MTANEYLDKHEPYICEVSESPDTLKQDMEQVCFGQLRHNLIDALVTASASWEFEAPEFLWYLAFPYSSLCVGVT